MTVDTMNSPRLTRLIQADRQEVWNVWPQPDLMKQWSCPEPGGVQEVESDFRVGETLVTVEFEAHGEATEVVLVHSGFPAVEAKEGHEQGWGACIAHFEALFS
jgi:uncharacterized protein YndB with AHSA1/START domain